MRKSELRGFKRFQEAAKRDGRIWVLDYERNGIQDSAFNEGGTLLARKGSDAAGLFVLITQQGFMAMGEFSEDWDSLHQELKIAYRGQMGSMDEALLWLADSLQESWFKRFTTIGALPPEYSPTGVTQWTNPNSK